MKQFYNRRAQQILMQAATMVTRLVVYITFAILLGNHMVQGRGKGGGQKSFKNRGLQKRFVWVSNNHCVCIPEAEYLHGTEFLDDVAHLHDAVARLPGGARSVPSCLRSLLGGRLNRSGLLNVFSYVWVIYAQRKRHRFQIGSKVLAVFSVKVCLHVSFFSLYPLFTPLLFSIVLLYFGKVYYLQLLSIQKSNPILFGWI